MPLLFWDASALAKRYALETGSDTVDELFVHVPAHMMMTTPLGYAETYAVLVRKLNEGRLDLPTFSVAATALQDEVIDSADFALLAVDDTAILAGVPLIRAHNLNSADATILSV